MGWTSFLEAAAAFYRREFGVTVDPASDIVQLIGSKEGLAHLMLATLDRGDTVLVPDPSYPFLGVHFTRRIGGAVDIGPNAVLAFARVRVVW